MTYTEILELIRAGYKKEEIDAMMQDPTPAPSPTPAPDPDPSPAPAPAQADADPGQDPAPAAAPAPAPVASEADKLAAALGLKLDSILKAVQVNNVRTSEQSGAGTLTAEDVIASIINPPNLTNGGAK